MADVFLSYARASAREAMRIAKTLREAGFSVWYDESLPAHRLYSDVIEEQLKAASAVVVLWSAEATHSQWVRSEANRARETGRLVQARLDEATLPMPFDQIQCADLRGWTGDSDGPAWRCILESVAALAGDKQDSPVPERPRAARPSRISRRAAMISGGAVAIGGVAGLALWRRGEKPEPSPEAQLLIAKGNDALQNNDALDPQDIGSTAQAIALLSEATRVAPQSATAWGALAMAYAVRMRVVSPAERPGLDARSRAAARTALELDPREPRGLAALRLLEPVYRNWMAAERADRDALRKGSRMPILMFILSDMLGNVGRWREATEISDRFDSNKFLIPGADRKVIINLWASGDLQGADRAIDAAVRRWPQHPQIWRARMAYLMYSGRSTEALALLRDSAEHPVELSPTFIEAVRVTAEALAGQREAVSAIGHDLDYLKENPKVALQVAQACSALGSPDEAFALLDGYYFAVGKWEGLAPPGGDQDRVTNALFQPPMRGLWRDRRFGPLVERIGLNRYWQQSGTVPDFRRSA